MSANAARSAVFRAVADPTRREILRLLRGGKLSVGEIAGNFRASRPAISKHLRLLRDAGLVRTQRRGVTRLCELNPTPLREIQDWLHNLKHFVEEHR